ncbi:MAG: F0F1 ATP synthase subunit A [Micavibrio sp.]|nr:MAG: F0F1 ATP synthase subunit A [Micavibrio sp.]
MAGPLDQFVIKPIIPIEIGGVDLSFTQSSLWMAFAIAAASLITVACMAPRAMVPGRWQNIPEALYDFVSGMVRETLGKEGNKYFPLVFTIFITVLMGNVLGMIPYSFTFTSHIIVTGALALFVFLLATGIGIVRHGLHFFSLFLPKGLPWFFAPLIVVIEIISYLSRPISLSVRLFANMVAGHTMLKVFAGFSVSMGIFFGVLPMLLNVALIGLEFLIAFIQAYVFALLTCIYLKDAIELH